MKTETYNPSPLEVDIAKAIGELNKEIEKRLSTNSIQRVESNLRADNPVLTFFLVDEEKDKHVVVVRVIQRIDRE
ncbi:hypothetical protein E1171_10820 [Cytophagales bacterium RKSG123]|nr:hypothetical protein [Xanthovirga aplysinae]